MPLWDHFHPPLRNRHHGDGFHSAWANTLVRHLSQGVLPSGYRAEPEVALGTQVEVDVAALREQPAGVPAPAGNGIATAVWAPPRPTRSWAADFAGQDTFAVRVYDDE